MASRQSLLRNQRMRLPMPQISRRRANQLGNFMGVLKLCAIDLDHRARVAKENLGGGFNNSCLARTRRPEKQQIPYRTARRIQSGAKDLVQVHQCLHTLFLSDDFPLQRGLEIDRVGAALAGIERKNVVSHDRLLANPGCGARAAKSPASTAKLVQLDLNR